MESALMEGGTEPTGLGGSHVYSSPLGILHPPISCPEVKTGDSRRGNVHVVSTFQALWTKMLFHPFSMHKDVSVPNYCTCLDWQSSGAGVLLGLEKRHPD